MLYQGRNLLNVLRFYGDQISWLWSSVLDRIVDAWSHAFGSPVSITSGTKANYMCSYANDSLSRKYLWVCGKAVCPIDAVKRMAVQVWIASLGENMVIWW